MPKANLMSKMNNNSRKSSKNTSSKSSKAKRTSKKNFKIENLEPRLMMDAASGFEADKIDTYVESFASISTELGEGFSKTLENIEKFDFAELGLTEKFDSFTALLGKTSETIKSEVTDYVGKILSNAMETVQEKAESLSVSDFVKNYVQDEINGLEKDGYKGISIEAEGNKLVFTYNISKTQSLNSIKYGTESWGSLSMEGSSNLECEAAISVSVNLDANNDGSVLTSSSDFSVESFSIGKLQASIKELGMNLKFMNMNLVEVEDGGDDISLKYENSEFKKNIDLEFKLEGAEDLPFCFAEGEYIKVSNRNGSLDVSIPEIQMKETNTLGYLVKALDFVNVPFLDGKVFDINGAKQSVADETNADLSLSYNGTAVSNNIDLESCIRMSSFDIHFLVHLF